MTLDDDFDLPPLEEVSELPEIEPTIDVSSNSSGIDLSEPVSSILYSDDDDLTDEEIEKQTKALIDRTDDDDLVLVNDSFLQEDMVLISDEDEEDEDFTPVPSDFSNSSSSIDDLLEIDDDEDDLPDDKKLQAELALILSKNTEEDVEEIDDDDDSFDTTSESLTHGEVEDRADELERLLSDDSADEESVSEPVDRFDETPDSKPEEDDEETDDSSSRQKLSAFFASFMDKVKSEIGVDSDDKPNKKNAPTESVNKGSKRSLNVPSPILKIVNLLLMPFRKVHSLFVTILTKILDLLGKLPLVGKLFNLIQKTPHVVNIAAFVIPFLLVFWTWLQFTKMPFTNSDSIELPDMGGASAEVISSDQSKGQAVVRVKNTGDVIAEVRPSLVVASSDWWNPSTWYAVKDRQKCLGKPVRIPIDSSVTVPIKCMQPLPSTNVKFGARLEKV